MKKAFTIGLTAFILTVSTASAQTEPVLLSVPQDTSILDLAYPYYDLVVTPSATFDPVDSSTSAAPDPTQPTDSTNNEPSTRTPPTNEPTSTEQPTEPNEPGGTFSVPSEEPTDDTTAATDPETGISGGTLFVPPEREPVIPEDPTDPRQPITPRDPRQPTEPEEPRECPEQTICPTAQEVIDRTVPQITTNQWRVAIIVFGGAATGGALWFIISLLFNNAHSKREQAILHTRATVKNSNHRVEQLKNGHEKVGEAIADITNSFANDKKPTKKQKQALKQAGTEIELFGSQKSRKAYQNLLTTVEGKSSEKQFSTATKNLFSSLKKDLGLR